MLLITIFDVDTSNNRFTLAIHGDPDGLCVARYWNLPRRPLASIVRRPTGPADQLSGEVSAMTLEGALKKAKSEIQEIDGTIIACIESPLYRWNRDEQLAVG